MEEAAGKSTHPNPHTSDGVADINDVHVTNRNDRKQVSSGILVCCMPCYWLRTNTSLHKASLTVITLLVTSLLVASPVLFLISSVPANEQPTYKQCNLFEDEGCSMESTVPDVPLLKCDSAVCKDIARRLRYTISWDHDPCKNFYEFACGGWSESQKADSSRPNSLSMDLSVFTLQKRIMLLIQNLIKSNGTYGRFKKIGDFHSSCMESLEKPVDMTRMYTVLDQLGGYLPPGSLGPNNLTPLIASILKVSGTPLIDLSMLVHFKNKSIPCLVVDLPDGITELLQSYQPDSMPQNVFQKYYTNSFTQMRLKRDTMNMKNPYNYIKGKNLETKLIDLEKIAYGMLPKRMDQMEKANEIQQILLFASTVQQLLPGQKQLKREMTDFSINASYTEQKLQDDFPIVNWGDLLNELIPDYQNIKTNIKIYVISTSYMRNLSNIINKFKNRIIHNALLAMYARDYLYHIVDMKKAKLNDSQLYCTTMTIHTFPFPVSGLYLSHYTKQYLEDLEKRTDEMFSNLKLSLFNHMKKASWIDNDSRWKAMDRITELTAKFITWSPLPEVKIINQTLENMIITNDFFDNMMNHYRQKRFMQMSYDDVVPVDMSWPYPFVVNAFYDPIDNCVVLPLAFLTQPYFSPGLPAYIPYSSIGVILAHEMMHSLDYSNFQGNGISPLWADSKSLAALQSRLSCVANSYHSSPKKGFKFMGENVDIELDGNYTLDETIADLSGTQIAWGAWRQLENADKEITLSSLPLAPNRLFFLSLSQLYCSQISIEDYIVAIEENSHAIAPERVNGLVRNNFAFAESYQCSSDSPMNPAMKCNIW